LPIAYKSFILFNNGGRPIPNNFQTYYNEYETDIQFLFGITSSNTYDLFYNYKEFSDIFENHLLPIAVDSGGNLVLLNTLNEKVYFYVHDTGEVYFVADDFEIFLNQIYKIKVKVNEFDKAISIQDTSYFERRLENGELINQIVNEFNQPVTIVTALRNKLNLLKFFVDRGADISLALFNASGRGNFEIVKYLLSQRANPSERDVTQNNDTALMQACQAGHLEIAKLLMENGAQISDKNAFGDTALTKALWSNNEKLIEYIERVNNGYNEI
jgi:hypothetical protein